MSDDIRSLSDHDLLETCDRMMRRDRQHMAAFLRHLAEVDERKLWARMGYGSLFDFCVGRWNMSNGEAGSRIHAARAARRFPVIFDMVARGELHLTGVNGSLRTSRTKTTAKCSPGRGARASGRSTGSSRGSHPSPTGSR